MRSDIDERFGHEMISRQGSYEEVGGKPVRTGARRLLVSALSRCAWRDTYPVLSSEMKTTTKTHLKMTQRR